MDNVHKSHLNEISNKECHHQNYLKMSGQIDAWELRLESGSSLVVESTKINGDGARPKISSPVNFQCILLEQLVRILVD